MRSLLPYNPTLSVMGHRHCLTLDALSGEAQSPGIGISRHGNGDGVVIQGPFAAAPSFLAFSLWTSLACSVRSLCTSHILSHTAHFSHSLLWTQVRCPPVRAGQTSWCGRCVAMQEPRGPGCWPVRTTPHTIFLTLPSISLSHRMRALSAHQLLPDLLPFKQASPTRSKMGRSTLSIRYSPWMHAAITCIYPYWSSLPFHCKVQDTQYIPA